MNEQEEPVTAAACRSNIAFFREQCKKYTHLAVEARLEEQRYELLLKLLEDPDAALRELSDPEPTAEPGYN